MINVLETLNPLIESSIDRPPIIVCMYTGLQVPDYCAKMPREPEPPVGEIFEHDFPKSYARALIINRSVHDGAVMVGRRFINDDYRIIGWSFRLFPAPPKITIELNRGSAFNSCLAMSFVQSVDNVYLISKGSLLSIESGRVVLLRGA